jgi:HEAT repeat protein
MSHQPLRKRRRWYLRILLVGTSLLVLAGLLYPNNWQCLVGWIRGEPFYQGLPARYWTQQLKHEEQQRVDDAQRVLEEGGVDAIPVLHQAALDANAGPQAFKVILKLGDRAVPALIDLLQTPDEEHLHARIKAAQALGQLGPTASSAIPVLGKALKDRSIAASSGLDSERGAIHLRVAAVEALAHMGPESCPWLGPALDQSDTRKQALAILERWTPRAREAIPVLMEAVKDENEALSPSERGKMVQLLGRFGSQASDAVDLLLTQLQDNPPYSDSLVRSLIQIAPEDDRLVAAFARLIPKGPGHSPTIAITYLSRRAIKEGEKASPELIRLLLQNASLQYGTALDDVCWPKEALLKMGPVVVTELVKLITNERAKLGKPLTPFNQPFMQWLELLYQFDPDNAVLVPNLRMVLQLPETAGEQFRQAAAARLVGKIGPSARRAIPDMIRLLENSGRPRVDPEYSSVNDYRIDLINALGTMGSEAKEAVPLLIPYLQSPDVTVRSQVVLALARIGPAATEAVSALRQTLREAPTLPLSINLQGHPGQKYKQALANAKLKALAAYALWQINQHPDAIPAFIELLETRHQEKQLETMIHHQTAELLCEIGPPGKKALPLLTVNYFGHVLPAAAYARWRIDQDDSAVDDLAKVLDSNLSSAMLVGTDNWYFHRQAAIYLREIGGKAAAARPALLRGCKHGNVGVRAACIKALATTGPATSEVIGCLQGGLQDDGKCAPGAYAVAGGDVWLVRAAAAEALAELGPPARAALPQLQEARKDEWYVVRRAAAKAIQRIKGARE